MTTRTMQIRLRISMYRVAATVLCLLAGSSLLSSSSILNNTPFGLWEKKDALVDVVRTLSIATPDGKCLVTPAREPKEPVTVSWAVAVYRHLALHIIRRLTTQCLSYTSPRRSTYSPVVCVSARIHGILPRLRSQNDVEPYRGSHRPCHGR